MTLALYKVSYADDGKTSFGPNIINRDAAYSFADNMKSHKSAQLIAVLIKSKIKCCECKENPVWSVNDLCPPCRLKLEQQSV